LGVLASGRIERVAPPDEGLPIESTDILARVSKAVGVLGSLADLIDLRGGCRRAPTLRLWNVLMVSAGSGVLTRFALRLTLSWTGTTRSCHCGATTSGGG
jgi:hypothetical protein